MPMYNKKSAFLKGDRRNPCRYLVERVVKDSFKSYENYGFVQERDMKNKMSVITKLSTQPISEQKEALLRQKAMLIIMKKPTPYVWKRVT